MMIYICLPFTVAFPLTVFICNSKHFSIT